MPLHTSASRYLKGAMATCLLLVLTVVIATPQPEPSEPFPHRIVVVGDVHGDHDKLIQVLTLAGLIDRRARWTGGKTHLVQLGDLPDRGDDTRKVIEFMRKLERNARRRGGAVHILVGNHDAMNVYGDLRDVTEGEFSAFAERQSKKRLEALYKSEIEWILDNVPEEERPEIDEAFREKWFAMRPPGFLEHRLSWLPDGEIGKWVRSRPAVLKLGDSLFVHGGLGPGYEDWSIEAINKAVSESLNNVANVEGTILRDQDGPLWYRGLALHPEDEEREHLEALLANFGVSRIVVGHTVTGGVILPRFNGRVVKADVGLSKYYGDFLACLIIEDNTMQALYRNGSVTIPMEQGDDGLRLYLEEVLALEEGNPHIERYIRALDNPPEDEEDPSLPIGVID